jgi:hypothetical protein
MKVGVKRGREASVIPSGAPSRIWARTSGAARPSGVIGYSPPILGIPARAPDATGFFYHEENRLGPRSGESGKPQTRPKTVNIGTQCTLTGGKYLKLI